jgi:hypothetical protein
MRPFSPGVTCEPESSQQSLPALVCAAGLHRRPPRFQASRLRPGTWQDTAAVVMDSALPGWRCARLPGEDRLGPSAEVNGTDPGPESSHPQPPTRTRGRGRAPMSLAHRPAVIASLVSGGFLVLGPSVSTQDPALASAGHPLSVPLLGRGRPKLPPRCVQHTKPITMTGRSRQACKPLSPDKNCQVPEPPAPRRARGPESPADGGAGFRACGADGPGREG